MKSSLTFIGLIILVFASQFARANDLPKVAEKDLVFVPNYGQWEGDFLYRADIHGGTLFLDKKGFTYLFQAGDVVHGHDHAHGSRFIEVDGQKVENDDFHEHELPETESAHAYKIHFLGADEVPTLPFERLSEYHNYYYGSDPAGWKTNVPLYRGVKYPNLYEGIDLMVYSDQASVKYDFIVAPGISPAAIKLRYDGVDGMTINQEGHLEIYTSVNTVIEYKPYAYQWVNGVKQEVECHYQLKGGLLQYVFPTAYDATRELVIDPVLVFSTYSGSTADNWGFSATNDKDGNMYIGGVAFGSGYPVTAGAFQNTFRGATTDVAITKLSANGSQRLFSTYLGGNRSEYPSSLIVDDQNNLIVYGVTSSNNFPVSGNAFQNTFRGGANITPIASISFTAGSDIFLTKFNANGTNIVGSTYYGGTANDGINSNNGSSTFPTLFNYGDNSRGEVNLTPDGRILIASCTFSDNIAITPGAAQPNRAGNQDGLVACFNQNLSQLLFSTYLGGSNADGCYSIQVDNNGDLFLCGGTASTNFPGMTGGVNTTYRGGRTDGFIVKMNPTATAFRSGTYVGTNNYDQTFLIDLDRSGAVYTVGQTLGNYPTTAGVYRNVNAKQFIHKFSNDLSTTIYATTFGTPNYSFVNISPTALLVDDCENVHVVGWGGGANWDFQASGGRTSNMPVTSDAFKSSTDGDDFYLFTLKRNGEQLLFGSYFGENGNSSLGTGQDHVDGGTSRFDKQGIVYQGVCASCGETNGFPTTPGVVSRNNRSDNCNMAAFKFQFDLEAIQVLNLGVSSDSGCAPLTVNFNYVASKPGTRFEWIFGDGGSSNQEFPTYTFNTPGTYRVKFIIENPNNCNILDSAFTTIIVTERDRPEPSFTIDSSQVCTNGTVILTNTSQKAKRYEWNFGDGTTSTSSAPTLTKNYAAPGTYTITLTAFNNELCDSVASVVQTVRIPDIVDADFNFSGTFCTGNTISFTNLSANATNYTWTFSPGNTSTDVNPSFVFNQAGTFSVTLVANNPLTCNVNDEVTKDITIDEAPVLITPEGPIELCTGQSALLTATPGFASYVWRKDGAFVSGVNGNTLTATQTGAYQVQVTSTGTCPGISNIVQVNVQDNVTIDLDPDTARICPGAEATLSILTSGLQAVEWFRDGVSVTSGQNSITTNLPGIYTVTAQTSIGCPASSNPLPVVQEPVPAIGIAPAGPNTICENTEITLTASPANLQSIQWFRDGVAISGASSLQFTTGLAGNYTVTAQSPAGCEGTSPAVEVIISTEINLQITPSGSLTLCPTAQQALTITTTGIQNIQWQIDGADIPGATTATITVSQPGVYTATAQSLQGCPGTSNVVNVAYENPLTINLSANKPGYCPGDSVTLSISNTGLQDIGWSLNGTAIPGAQGATLVVQQGGTYTVTANSANNCPGTSNPIVVASYQNPAPLISPQGTISICPGTDATLTLTPATLLNIQWFLNGQPIPGANVLSILTGEEGAFTVTAENADGCRATSNEVLVEIVDIIPITFDPPGPLAFCDGESRTVSIAPAGLNTIVWFRNGVAIPGATSTSYTITQGGTYTVTANNAQGCPASSGNLEVTVNFPFTVGINPAGPVSICAGEASTLTITTPDLADIQWFRNGTAISGANGQTLEVNTAGNYSVTSVSAITGCAGTSAPVSVTVNPLPVVSIAAQGPLEFCEGGQVVLNAQVSNAAVGTYSWTLNGAFLSDAAQVTASQSGTYALRVVSDLNCSGNTAEVQVVVKPFPNIELGDDIEVCAGSPVTLDASFPGANYVWNTGATTATISPQQSGLYSVIVNLNGCEDIDQVNVTFFEVPVVNAGPDQAICLGELATISPQISLSDVLTWNSGQTTASITVDDAGIYIITATLGFCSASDTVIVRFKAPAPTVTLGPDTAICATEVLVLDPIGENIQTYLWQDGSTNSTYTVNQPGVYTVFVEGECGTDGASKTIEFLDCECQVVVPSAWTPNGDGVNDILTPLARCEVDNLLFQVFNRWGEKVFESNDLRDGWDGVFRGERQPTDAYIYYVRYRNIPLNKFYEVKGTAVMIM